MISTVFGVLHTGACVPRVSNHFLLQFFKIKEGVILTLALLRSPSLSSASPERGDLDKGAKTNGERKK
jgi:hypothetical protein